MILNVIRHKKQTEDFFLSYTENYETLIDQTHTKPQETLEFKITKPRETFHFQTPNQINGDWIIGITSLEVYNSIFNMTLENNKFELYTDIFDECSFVHLKDEVAEILKVSDITPYHQQHEPIEPRIIETFKEIKFRKIKH